MEIAAVQAVADLARAEQSEVVSAAYGSRGLAFGPEYLIPKPFDPRLIERIAPAVARAAMASGVATRPIADFDAYRAQLEQFVYHSGTFMQPVFATARKFAAGHSRIAFAEGEDERVLRAAQVLVDEGLARPVLVGRADVTGARLRELGLRLRRDVDFSIVEPGEAAGRDPTEVAARLLQRQEVDGMICGTMGTTAQHLGPIRGLIGLAQGASVFAGMSGLILPGRRLFIVDTHVNQDPDDAQLAEITCMAAEAVRRFGVEPKVALVSHSNFGSSDAPSARKLRRTLALVRQRVPQAAAALTEQVARFVSRLRQAPYVDAFQRAPGIAESVEWARALVALDYNLLKTAAGNKVAIGPVLLGCAAPAHILTPAATVRRIVNMAALAVVQANSAR